MDRLIIGSLVLMLGFSTCSVPEKKPTSTGDYKATLLFEQDGAKVYKFTDGGTTVYYIDARGMVSWKSAKYSGGRLQITEQVSITKDNNE